MFERGLIEPAKLLEYFSAIEPRVYRYPAIDAKSFRLAAGRCGENDLGMTTAHAFS